MIIIPCMFRRVRTIFMLFIVSDVFTFSCFSRSACFTYVIPTAIYLYTVFLQTTLFFLWLVVCVSLSGSLVVGFSKVYCRLLYYRRFLGVLDRGYCASFNYKIDGIKCVKFFYALRFYSQNTLLDVLLLFKLYLIAFFFLILISPMCFKLHIIQGVFVAAFGLHSLNYKERFFASKRLSLHFFAFNS